MGGWVIQLNILDFNLPPTRPPITTLPPYWSAWGKFLKTTKNIWTFQFKQSMFKSDGILYTIIGHIIRSLNSCCFQRKMERPCAWPTLYFEINGNDDDNLTQFNNNLVHFLYGIIISLVFISPTRFNGKTLMIYFLCHKSADFLGKHSYWYWISYDTFRNTLIY